MDAVIRATAIYLVLLLLFRVLGKRTMAQVTTFDFVLLLIVSEATQQALLGDDFSVTNAVLVIATLMAWSYVADVAGFRNKRLQKVAQSIPLVLVADGTPLTDRMREENVDESEILAAARAAHGLQRMEQIRYAVLEQSGGISIVPTAER